MARTGYAQLSNQLWLNDKANDLLEADPLAFGIWVMSISYASDNLTDGLLTRRALRRLGADESICATLVEFGVWERVDDTTVRIHDYLKHNVSREYVETERAAAAERKRRQRQRDATDTVTQDETQDATPDETRDKQQNTPQDVTQDVTRDIDRDTERDGDVTSGVTFNQNQEPKNINKTYKTHTEVRGVGEGEEPTPEESTFEDRQFDTLWDTWPKKTAKRDARRAYHHALRRTNATVILAAATRIRDDPNKPETRYLPRLDRWLDSDGWHDDPYPPTTRGEPASAKPRALTNAEYNRQFIESLPD